MGLTDSAQELLVDESEAPMTRDRHSVVTSRAIVTEARGSLVEAHELFVEAAGRWSDYGHVLEHGYALLGAGRCLLAMRKRDDAAVRLQEARAIFTKLQARPLIDEVDRHLGETTALSG